MPKREVNPIGAGAIKALFGNATNIRRPETAKTVYVIQWYNGLQLVARRDGKILWNAGESGTHCDWPKGLKPLKAYRVKDDDLNAVYLRFYRDFPLKPNEPKQSGGWVSPEGVFYACGHMKHIATAEHLTGQLYGRADTDGEKLLEEKGWAHIYADGTTVWGHPTRDVTQKQLDALFDIARASTGEFGAAIEHAIDSWKDTITERAA